LREDVEQRIAIATPDRPCHRRVLAERAEHSSTASLLTRKMSRDGAVSLVTDFVEKSAVVSAEVR
jgi:hypothetical protein